MKVCYLVANNGDGSTTVHFFQSEKDAQALLDNEANLETYGSNEGEVRSFDINPDGTTTIQWTQVPAHA